ncbi:MAG: hypothetical protein L0H70_02030 [Xanthomonadales bacterium]|nr:hypothetical protein [Xanthomonadales bacterium]
MRTTWVMWPAPPITRKPATSPSGERLVTVADSAGTARDGIPNANESTRQVQLEGSKECEADHTVQARAYTWGTLTFIGYWPTLLAFLLLFAQRGEDIPLWLDIFMLPAMLVVLPLALFIGLCFWGWPVLVFLLVLSCLSPSCKS